MSTSANVQCPRCASEQFTTQKKGFSGKKAAAGAILVGPIGALAGTIGSNKIEITCLNCGHTFKPGHGKKPVTNADVKLIWDDDKKQYTINPNYKGGVQTFKVSSLLYVMLVIVILIILIVVYK